MKKILAAACLWAAGPLVLAGCAPSRALVKTARQNVENGEALSRNTLMLISINEKQLEATADAYLLTTLSQVRKELIEIVGRASGSGPAPSATWDDLFAGKAPYSFRRGEVVNVLKQTPREDQIFELRRKHGWIFLTVHDSAFTPSLAHKLLQQLQALQDKSGGDAGAYVQKARVLCAGLEPRVEIAYAEVDAAREAAKALRDTILRQLNYMDLHGRAILANAEGTVQVGEVVRAIADNQQLQGLVENAIERNIPDKHIRRAAAELLLNTQRGGEIKEAP